MAHSLYADHPVAIRYPNGGDRGDVTERFRYGNEIARADFAPGTALSSVIVTYGRIVSEAMAACDAENQDKNASCGVILLEKLKPYGEVAEAVGALLPPTVKKVVFLEEGIANGGAGMILRDKLALPEGCAYHHIAIDDVFDTDRATGNLYADFGIGREDVLMLL
jgi:deoxyxylulose-5-phosphate synthase